MDCRFYGLATLAIGLAMCYYYNADMLQTLEHNFKQHPYFFSSLQFNMLYFCTYCAQFLFLLPLGILVDKFPLQVVTPILVGVTIIAQGVLGLLLQSRSHGYQ